MLTKLEALNLDFAFGIWSSKYSYLIMVYKKMNNGLKNTGKKQQTTFIYPIEIKTHDCCRTQNNR